MTADEVLELLWQDDPYNHSAWSSFLESVRDAQMSRDVLNKAWWFFRLGWEARHAL